MNNKLKKKIKKKCDFYITKTGKIKYCPTINNTFLCIIKNKYLYHKVFFNELFKIKSYHIIIHNLLQLYNLFKLNLNYIIINKVIHIFNDKNYNNVIQLLCINIIYKNPNTKIYKYLYKGNTIKDLTIEFMIFKLLSKTVSDLELLTIIFYQSYINSSEIENILLKYNKSLLDFENYNKLYIFLKKIGVVDKYYNNYSKKIIKNYPIIYKKIYKYIEKNNLSIFFKKKIKYFRDINPIELILKIIDKYISNDLKKIYIKNEFIKIIENYNIK